MRPLSHILCATVAATLAGLTLATGAAHAAGEGKVRFINDASSSWDRYTSNPSPALAGWMRERFYRQKTYAPYFDSRTSWYPNAWTYRDLYAIYRSSTLVTQHPDWILKDSQGRNLFIPWGCDDGTCPQFAGDVGNPAFRAHWIANMRETLAEGNYRGIHIDDVNMEFRVSNGDEKQTAPLDSRTGATMTSASWRRYVAEFTEEIRAAFPNVEISHNAIWFADQSDAFVKRAHEAADYINLERGVNDDGLVGGGGRWGYETFLAHVDQLHARGKHVVFDSYSDSRSEAEYNLASYLLINRSQDGFKAEYRDTPDNWWTAGYELDLGAARGERYAWNGLLRRDFDRGYVLVNQPDRPIRSVTTPGATTLDGQLQGTTSLAGGAGIVLLDESPLPTAPPAPGPIVLDPQPNPQLPVPPSPSEPPKSPKSPTPTEPTPAQPSPQTPAPRKVNRGSKRGGRSKSRKAGPKRRLNRAVLLRGRVRKAARGKVRLVVHRKGRGGNRVVRRTTARVGAKGRFGRLLRGLPPARYVAVASYRSGPKGTKVLRKRHFTIRH